MEFAEETDRKIIDAEEAAVFERPEESSLPRAAQAGDDDERRLLHGVRSSLRLNPSDVAILPFVDHVEALGIGVSKHEKVAI